MKLGLYTTVIITQDGKHYDRGKEQFPPSHEHSKPGKPYKPCPACNIVDARTMSVDDVIQR